MPKIVFHQQPVAGRYREADFSLLNPVSRDSVNSGVPSRNSGADVARQRAG